MLCPVCFAFAGEKLRLYLRGERVRTDSDPRIDCQDGARSSFSAINPDGGLAQQLSASPRASEGQTKKGQSSCHMSHCTTAERPEVKIHMCLGGLGYKKPPAVTCLELFGTTAQRPRFIRRRLFHHKRADLRWEVKRSRWPEGSFHAHRQGDMNSRHGKTIFHETFLSRKKNITMWCYNFLITQQLKKLLCSDSVFHLLVSFTSLNRTAGWLQEHMGELSW